MSSLVGKEFFSMVSAFFKDPLSNLPIPALKSSCSFSRRIAENIDKKIALPEIILRHFIIDNIKCKIEIKKYLVKLKWAWYQNWRFHEKSCKFFMKKFVKIAISGKKVNSTKNQKIILKRKDQKNCNITEKSIQTIFSILPKKKLVKLTNYTKILLFDGILKIDTFSVRKNVFLLGFDFLHAVAVNFGDFFQNFVGHDEFADLI